MSRVRSQNWEMGRSKMDRMLTGGTVVKVVFKKWGVK